MSRRTAIVVSVLIVAAFCILVLAGCEPAEKPGNGKKSEPAMKVIKPGYVWHFSQEDWGRYKSRGPLPKGAQLKQDCFLKVWRKSGAIEEQHHIGDKFTVPLGSSVTRVQMGGCYDLVMYQKLSK